MNPEYNPEGPAQGDRTLAGIGQSVKSSATHAGETLRDETKEWVDCASATIRENPLTMVASAFAFGIAVGCVIMASCHEDPRDKYFNEPLADASDAVTDSLRRLYANLKFW